MGHMSTHEQMHRHAMKTERPLLEVKSLSKVYKTGKRALQDVDFVVDRPQVIAVIGSSGAGKSTFIRCINRLVEPTSGRDRKSVV